MGEASTRELFLTAAVPVGQLLQAEPVLSLPWLRPAAFVPLLPSPPFGRVLRGKAEGELTGVPQVGAGGDCVGFGRQAQSTWGGRGG